MKILKIKKLRTEKPVMVSDCYVDNGFRKAGHGSLPDIDTDFSAERRDEVKSYLERRYNKSGLQRVFSAGTFTTEKIKSAIKDIARVYKVPVATVNYLTAMLDDNMSWTDLMKKASVDKRIRNFIQKYPEVFEEILPIMGQARSAGIHASAIIITPEYIKGEHVSCFDLLPIRKMGNLLVSEISGSNIDSIGILKNDVLGIKEPTKFHDCLQLIEQEYGVKYTMLEIATKYIDDAKVYDMLKAGYTQGIFQLSGDGITKFIKRLSPECIDDVIAAVALFRPGALNSGAAENYILAKRGEVEPQYLWGTYDILKDTYAQFVYQEQISQVAQKVGGLSLGDGIDLIKALSKKKLESVRKFQDKFYEGALKNGCPQDVIVKLWSDIEDAAKYNFNKSHAATYGLTAYIGAWLKTHYPTAFYTVALKDQEEDRLPILMNEIRNIGGTELVAPDINVSDVNFTADFKHNKIYWSISRIKQLGVKAVNYIIYERNLFGEFYDMEDFIKRIFKNKFKSYDDESAETKERCPVTARSVKQLILAGAFDNCEKLCSINERYGLLERAAKLLGFTISEKEVPIELRDKPYFWSQQQIAVSGMGAIDYSQILKAFEMNKPLSVHKFIDFKDMSNPFYETAKGMVCATINCVSEKSYKDKKTGEIKHFGKIELQQNTYTNILTLWDCWSENKELLLQSEGKIIATLANVKWSDYDEKNVLQVNKMSYLKIV